MRYVELFMFLIDYFSQGFNAGECVMSVAFCSSFGYVLCTSMEAYSSVRGYSLVLLPLS